MPIALRLLGVRLSKLRKKDDKRSLDAYLHQHANNSNTPTKMAGGEEGKRRCPMCSAELVGMSNAVVNQHIDHCLERQQDEDEEEEDQTEEQQPAVGGEGAAGCGVACRAKASAAEPGAVAGGEVEGWAEAPSSTSRERESPVAEAAHVGGGPREGETPSCPVCGQGLADLSNHQVNLHLDSCLGVSAGSAIGKRPAAGGGGSGGASTKRAKKSPTAKGRGGQPGLEHFFKAPR